MVAGMARDYHNSTDRTPAARSPRRRPRGLSRAPRRAAAPRRPPAGGARRVMDAGSLAGSTLTVTAGVG